MLAIPALGIGQWKKKHYRTKQKKYRDNRNLCHDEVS